MWGFTSEKRKRSRSLTGSTPSQSTYNDPIFGPGIAESGDPPPLFSKFTRYLVAKGMTAQNIFADADQIDSKEIQLLKKKIKVEKESIQLSSYTKHPNAVAALLLEYLEQLPDTILTHKLYDSWMLVSTIPGVDMKISCLRQLFAQLPVGYRNSAKQLFQLLQRISSESDKNNMNSEKLANIFAPLILRSQQQLYYMEEDNETACHIIQALIDCFDILVMNTQAPVTDKHLEALDKVNRPVPEPLQRPPVGRFPYIRYQESTMAQRSYKQTARKPYVFFMQREKVRREREGPDVSPAARRRGSVSLAVDQAHLQSISAYSPSSPEKNIKQEAPVTGPVMTSGGGDAEEEILSSALKSEDRPLSIEEKRPPEQSVCATERVHLQTPVIVASLTLDDISTSPIREEDLQPKPPPPVETVNASDGESGEEYDQVDEEEPDNGPDQDNGDDSLETTLPASSPIPDVISFADRHCRHIMDKTLSNADTTKWIAVSKLMGSLKKDMMSLISEDLGFSRAEMISLLQSNPSVPLAESTPEDEDVKTAALHGAMVGSALSVIDALHFLSLKWDSDGAEACDEEGRSSTPVVERDSNGAEERDVAKKVRTCLLKTIEVRSKLRLPIIERKC